MSRDAAGLAEVAERVDPIASHPVLAGTLEAYFMHDGDRRRTARALCIELRTLDYRLRQVESLTGLSPRRSHQSRLLVAGMTGHRLLRLRRRARRQHEAPLGEVDARQRARVDAASG